MPFPQAASISRLSFEEKALFGRLAALNAAFEAAKSGKSAQSFAHRAMSSDAILEAFLHEIRAQK